MKHIAILKNPIQQYAWGSFSAIAQLQGKTRPSAEPQAEMWMGAHPKAPSLVKVKQRWHCLLDVIAADPQGVLGQDVAVRYNSGLPFLFKILAAAKPLSLQAHPDRAQARGGFERENRLGIPLDAAHRNYRDDNHKPECICALSPFWALNGFRDLAEIVNLMTIICPKSLNGMLSKCFQESGSEALKALFKTLVTLETEPRRCLLDEALENARRLDPENSIGYWMLQLARDYPDDIGILSPAFLNLICLQPGQALYLPAGQLHAYLDGLAVELMANSDNVLRGGLTTKHVDVAELLTVLDFNPQQVQILSALPISACESTYPSNADEFLLSAITLEKGQRYESSRARSVEILLCTQGRAELREHPEGRITVLNRGDSVLVPAALNGYEITGPAQLYKAAVPLEHDRKGR